jgi:hypothetical protein
MTKFLSIFTWLDRHADRPSVKLLNQLLPVSVCAVLFTLFMLSSWFFITHLVNPFSTEKILIEFHLVDFLVGFFLYFVTAVDYALIVGRMQVVNTGAKARFIMNVNTCVGCFVGVSIVLFLWGFAKEVSWLIIPLLIFAGSVMVKLAYEGIEYFEEQQEIPAWFRQAVAKILTILHFFTSIFTFWIPELGSPKVKKMRSLDLAKWAFFLPFIIGLDDLVGYMGAMTIYNVFSLLFGIYLADIMIDILIFISPALTKKLVENAVLSFLAAVAFIYLAYKSYSEAGALLHEHYHLTEVQLVAVLGALLVVGGSFSFKRISQRKVSTTK